MTLFYDFAYGMTPKFSNHFHSLGSELQVQTHMLSFLAPINIGFRAIYLPDINDYAFNVFFNIDFSSLY
jgi:hypothetical protein